MQVKLKIDKTAVEVAIQYIMVKKEQGERIIFRSEIRRLFFDEKTPALGYVFRELTKRGVIKKLNSKSYIIC